MIQAFHIFHLISVILLVSINFAAFAALLPERRKKLLMYSGICSLVVFLTGFGMHGMLKVGWPGWFLVKLVCWFVLSALAGLAFRQPGRVRQFSIATIVLTGVAVTMVYLRPF